jgi:hypothetical protein
MAGSGPFVLFVDLNMPHCDTHSLTGGVKPIFLIAIAAAVVVQGKYWELAALECVTKVSHDYASFLVDEGSVVLQVMSCSQGLKLGKLLYWKISICFFLRCAVLCLSCRPLQWPACGTQAVDTQTT